MTGGPLLVANLGAEEGEAPAGRHPPAVESAARLWRSLFDPPAFDWLPGPDGAAAWLNTEAAAAEADAAGRSLFGSPPAVVRRVHDKAFALEVARREGLLPACLRDLPASLEPGLLSDAPRALAEIAARLGDWPDWARRAFVLKPRLGSSGRGRVAGRDGVADTEAIRGALPRLAARGGALLEPWLDRVDDLSVALVLGPGGSVRLLGSLRQQLDPSGLYRGHTGEIDAHLRVHSGSPHEENVREAAAILAAAAAAQGYAGPAGLDAFSFRQPGGGVCLRAVTEWNARFTLGCIAIACVRRALPAARGRLGLEPGERLAFRFALEAPAGGWPAAAGHLEPLGPDATGPAVLLTRPGEPALGARPGSPTD